MSEPKPPEDLELKNIIDKLANFVARNGPEFENMTKQKQQGNPKFSFLFSGEFYPYYRYRVMTEQESLQATQQMPKSFQAPPKQPLLPNTFPPQPTEKLKAMIESCQEQIVQSEKNLSAQFQSIMQIQQKNIEERLIKLKMENVERDAKELRLSLEDLEQVLEPVITTCTKDAINNGKMWVLEHFTSMKHGETMMLYMLERLLAKEIPFEHRLHLIYLLNDIVHHCNRKGPQDMIEVIESSVLRPAFAFTHINANENEQSKMNKLLSLWESHKYFKMETIEQLKDPSSGLATYQAHLIGQHSAVVAEASLETNKQIQLLKQQHQDFVNHINSQITHLQQQLHGNNQTNNASDNCPETDKSASLWPPSTNRPPPFNNMQGPPPSNTKPPEVSLNFPDLTKPPPGFPPIPGQGAPPLKPPDLDLIPNIPYHDLPAGLIVPLVKLEDCDYTPLDPKALRLPPPMPPTERLLAAVEAFYAPPSHERPRDADGWEKLGLFEFFKAKNKAKSMKPPSATSNNINNNSNNNNDKKNSLGDSTQEKPGKRRFVENKKTTYKRSRSRSSSPRDRSFSRSRSPSPVGEDDRFDTYYESVDRNSRLQEDNKGHQLMRKMGWGGGGLGSGETGMLDPIEGGEVRDKVDQFKGLGMSRNDPFENYRKNMSTGFNHRMRERSDHRSSNRN